MIDPPLHDRPTARELEMLRARAHGIMSKAGKRRTEYHTDRAALGSYRPGRGAFVGG